MAEMTFEEFWLEVLTPGASVALDDTKLRRIYDHLVATGVDVRAVLSGERHDLVDLARLGEILVWEGCTCDCGHDFEGHDDDCERCIGCRVQACIVSSGGK